MVNKSFSIILTLLIITANIGLSNQDDGFVKELTDDNFDSFIKENDYVLVKFYAPWCGHCKKMAPDFKDAAEELQYTPYKLAKVDATIHKQAAQQAEVSGYPTLKFYLKGEMKEYSGERTKDKIVEWVKNRVEKYEDQLTNKKEGEPEMDEEVVILTDSNFDEFIKKNEKVFVKFYAPWCGHCKKMAPALASVAAYLAKNDPSIKIAKVDATKEKNEASKIGLRGYPTLRFYYKGQGAAYEGGREQADLQKFLTTKAANPSTELTSIDEIEEFKRKSNVVVVLFGGNELDTFKTFAATYNYAEFAHTFNEELFKHYRVKKGSVVLFKSFDEGRNELGGVYDVNTIKSFVEQRSIPNIINYEKNYERFIYNNAFVAIVFFFDYSSDAAEGLNNVMKDVAKRHKGKFLIVKSDIKDGDQKKWAEDIGVGEELLPCVILLDYREGNEGSRKFQLSKKKKITSTAVRKFITDWTNGNAEVFIKSEDVPEYQNDPVYVVVGKSFEAVVRDPSKDVLVEFYAPWCGHCQKLAPIYEELARTVSHNKNLVIAKMDATKNEVPGLSVTSFPQIKFFPAKKGAEPIDVQRKGEENIEFFIDFLKKNAVHPITNELDIEEEEEEEVEGGDL